MAKRHMLVDFTTPKQPKSEQNWDLCALCQSDTGEALQCPENSTTKNKRGIGYITLANDLLQFKQLGIFPHQIDLDKLDDGRGFYDTLSTNTAKWHKSCRLQFNQNKIKRLKKATCVDKPTFASSSCRTQSAGSKPVQDEQPVCFFL